jgi:hypothetical protein
VRYCWANLRGSDVVQSAALKHQKYGPRALTAAICLATYLSGTGVQPTPAHVSSIATVTRSICVGQDLERLLNILYGNLSDIIIGRRDLQTTDR